MFIQFFLEGSRRRKKKNLFMKIDYLQCVIQVIVLGKNFKWKMIDATDVSKLMLYLSFYLFISLLCQCTIKQIYGDNNGNKN